MADINVIVLPDGTEYPVSDYYLPVAISSPTNGQVLKYDATNHVWYNGDNTSGSSILYGTSAPTSQLGTDGCLYVKYTEGTGGASDTVDALYVKLDGAWCQISTGGGGGSTIIEPTVIDTLWSGSASGTGTTVALAKPYNDYDLIIFKCYNGDIAGYFGSTFRTDTLALNTNVQAGSANIGNSDRRVLGKFTDYDEFTINLTGGSSALAEITGYKFGTGWAVQPVIYSEEEREIGVWKDGKPLYERVVDLGADTSISYNSWTLTTVSLSGIDRLVLIQGLNDAGTACFGDLLGGNNNDYLQLQTSRNGDTVAVRYLIFRYTKTTDVAGSGHWTPQDVPSVHYSTDEHVVGEWIDGKTIYERTYTFTAPSSNTFTREDLGIPMSGISNAWIDVQNSFAKTSGMCTNVAFYDGNSTKPDQFGGYLNFLQTNLAFDYRVGSDLYSSNIVLTIRYTKSS